MAKETKKRACPTCIGKGVIAGICETAGEWVATNADGQICTPDQSCPTCKGKGYVDED